MLKRISGKPNVEWFTKTASTVLSNGGAVALSSGRLILATASTTQHVGVILRACISTDSDYASAITVPVDVPGTNDIFEADVKSGVTAAATGVGSQCDFFIASSGDTTDVTVDTGTNSHHQVTIVGFISASKVLVKINSLMNMVVAA